MFVRQGLVLYIRMGITSLDIKNSLLSNRAQIINILDFDSEKLSIIRTKNK